MHSRAGRALFVVAVVAVLAVCAAGPAGAEHGEPAGDTDIVEVQTVSDEGTETGVVAVSYSYHVGDDIAGLEVRLPAAVEPTNLKGFEATDDPRTFRWDERTAEPTIETRYAVNRSSPQGPEAVGTGGWTLIASPNERSTSIGYTVQRGTEVSVDRETVVDGQGVAGETMVYLGPHETVAADEGRIQVVVSDFATVPDREETLATVERALDHSTTTFDSGVDEALTLFVVGDPLRVGGLAIGSDFWVHDRTLPPELTVYHEFVHTQQRYEWTADSEWTVEGGADYYAALLALGQGEIQYAAFQRRLERGNSFEDVRLAAADTWAGTQANYRLGALVIAALDRELRARGGSFEGVLQRANAHEGAVDGADLERITAAVAGADLSDFFEAYVRSPPPEIRVPAPTVYDAGNDGAALTARGADTTTSEGEVARVPVEITNDGTETSLAPTLSVDAAGNATTLISDDNGTRAGDKLVFEHLPPGESIRTTILVEHGGENTTLSFSVEDMSGVSAATSATVSVVEESGRSDDGTQTDDSGGETAGNDSTSEATGDDATGHGFGVAAVVVALVSVTLLARRQPQEN